MQSLVIVGGGQAAAQIADEARRQGFSGPITLVTEEDELPYQRPPLSKQFLTGTKPFGWLLYREPHFYTKHAITVLRKQKVVSLDRKLQHVLLEDGRTLPYDRLALATGTRARTIDVPGADAAGVFYIRTIADVKRLRAALPLAQRVVVIGGGFIGLEAAAMMAQLGKDVVLLAAGTTLIPRVAPREISQFLLSEHGRRGIGVVLGATVAELRQTPLGHVEVCTDDGSYTADLVLVGIGAIPVTELAEAAGLVCDDGICVDEFARTSDPNILAAGDCTNHYNPLLGRRLRLETVHNAVEQGRTAGATAAGRPLPYAQTPWVWSDQYKIRMQCVGVETYDKAIVRGDARTGRFSVFLFRQDGLVGVVSINQTAIFAAARRMLNGRIPLSAAEAADIQVDLEKLAASRPAAEFAKPWALEERRDTLLAWGHS